MEAVSTNNLILGSGILSATGNNLYMNGSIILPLSGLFRAENYSTGTPTWTPVGGFGIAVDISTEPATQWLYYTGVWN